MKITKLLLLMCAAMLMLMMIGCSEDEDPETFTFTIQNLTGYTAIQLFYTNNSEIGWGDDRLGSPLVSGTNGKHVITMDLDDAGDLNNVEYDFMLVDEAGCEYITKGYPMTNNGSLAIGFYSIMEVPVILTNMFFVLGETPRALELADIEFQFVDDPENIDEGEYQNFHDWYNTEINHGSPTNKIDAGEEHALEFKFAWPEDIDQEELHLAIKAITVDEFGTWSYEGVYKVDDKLEITLTPPPDFARQ
jgi:hypothetical protein